MRCALPHCTRHMQHATPSLRLAFEACVLWMLCDLLSTRGPLLLHAKVRSLAPGRNPTYGAEEGDASHAGGISGAFTGPAAAAAASAAGSFCSGMSYCNRSAGSAGGSASHCSEDMDIWDLDMDLDMDLGAEVDLEAARDPAGRALNSSSPRAAAGYHSKPAATCHSRSSSSSSSSSNHSSLFQLPVSAAAGAALGSSSEEAFEWVALTAGPGQEGPSEVSQPDLCSGGTASNSSSARDAPSSWEQELPQQLLHGATSPLAATSAAGQAGVAEGGDVNRRSTTSAAGFDLDLQPVVELLTQGQVRRGLLLGRRLVPQGVTGVMLWGGVGRIGQCDHLCLQDVGCCL